MQFEHPEDKQFFADLLAEGDVNLLQAEFSDLFDFRHPAIKRWEFNKTKHKVLKELIEKHKGQCQLGISPECSHEERMEPDHIIPLSTNILNKELRDMKRFSSAKVEPQSFGSNHPRNLTLACRKCNGLKKHRILSESFILKILKRSH